MNPRKTLPSMLQRRMQGLDARPHSDATCRAGRFCSLLYPVLYTSRTVHCLACRLLFSLTCREFSAMHWTASRIFLATLVDLLLDHSVSPFLFFPLRSFGVTTSATIITSFCRRALGRGWCDDSTRSSDRPFDPVMVHSTMTSIRPCPADSIIFCWWTRFARSSDPTVVKKPASGRNNGRGE